MAETAEAAEAAFLWWEATPWLLAAASLVWNYLNFRRTTAIQRDVRAKTVRLEEFRSQIRAPIETSLAQVRSQRKALESLEASASPLDALKTDLLAFNQSIIAVLGDLEDALLRADESEFAQGSDWLDLLAEDRDACFQAMDTAVNPARGQADTVKSIVAAGSRLQTICNRVQKRIEVEVQSYL